MFDPYPPPKRKRTLTAADKKRIAAKQKWKCKKCRKTLPARFHVDHIKEFSKDGSDRPSNLQALCPNCHAEKTEKDRHKRKMKKLRDSKQREAASMFDGPSLFNEPKRGRRSSNPWDFRL